MGPGRAVALSELKRLARKARSADAIETPLGIEGTAARRYFGEFAGMLKGDAVGDSTSRAATGDHRAIL